MPRVGYGMGGLTRRATSEQGFADGVALLLRAFELGVRHFDTAHFYGDGLANRLLVAAFGTRRDEVFYATKAGALSVPGAPIPLTAGQRPEELSAAVDANLATLGTDRLDLVYLRRMDMRPGLIAEGDQVVPLDDQLGELVALRDAGKVAAIGVSHVSAPQLRAARPAGIAAVQNIYNLLDRSDEDMLRACENAGIAWIPYFPLGGGGEYARLPRVTADPVVLSVASELGATANQVGLAWLLSHAGNSVVIAGTSSLSHLEENVACGALTLPPAALERLESSYTGGLARSE